MPASLFGALHEAGHALYEQFADPAFVRTPLATDLVGLYAVSGVSFGAHESQSRLFENHVGRSREFWDLNFAAGAGRLPRAARRHRRRDLLAGREPRGARPHPRARPTS